MHASNADPAHRGTCEASFLPLTSGICPYPETPTQIFSGPRKKWFYSSGTAGKASVTGCGHRHFASVDPETSRE